MKIYFLKEGLGGCGFHPSRIFFSAISGYEKVLGAGLEVYGLGMATVPKRRSGVRGMCFWMIEMDLYGS